MQKAGTGQLVACKVPRKDKCSEFGVWRCPTFSMMSESCALCLCMFPQEEIQMLDPKACLCPIGFEV